MSSQPSDQQNQADTPQSPRDLFHKAVAMEQEGNIDGATAYYRFCIAVDPTQAQALFRLGNLLINQGKARESLPYFKVLTLLNPEYIPARINFAIAYKKLGMLTEALEQLQAGSEYEPDHLTIWQQLADGYRTAGQLEEALAAYQKWVELAPDDAKAIHMVDALKAKLDGDYKAPERASDAYVASYFDQYAKSFDSHTASVLRYQVPLMLKNLAERSGLMGGENLSVLDLGCGTGQCGVFMAPVAARLDGIDLSPAMLAEARKKNIYTGLMQGDLVTEMQKLNAHDYHVVIAGDVFCYIGDLAAIFEQVDRLLGPGGVFLFTSEALTYNEQDAGHSDYVLRDSGRYAQHRHYLEGLAEKHGFEVEFFGQETIRLEYGKPLAGWVVVLRKSGD